MWHNIINDIREKLGEISESISRVRPETKPHEHFDGTLLDRLGYKSLSLCQKKKGRQTSRLSWGPNSDSCRFTVQHLTEAGSKLEAQSLGGD